MNAECQGFEVLSKLSVSREAGAFASDCVDYVMSLLLNVVGTRLTEYRPRDAPASSRSTDLNGQANVQRSSAAFSSVHFS